MEKIDITQEEQLPEVLKWALAGNKSFAVQGNGSKSELGRPLQTDCILSMSSLQGVEMHEPAELVMQAKTGTRLSDIQAILKQAGQKLAFSPPDLGPLLGTEAGASTIGGVFGCNLSGSSRIKAGAARDHLLGVKGFSGRGEAFQTGSRVMKNVTGYDLCKLVCGSYGTIALYTSLTFKVLPDAEKKRTVLIFGLAPDEAVRVMKDAMSSVHDVSAASYLPEQVAVTCDISHVTDAQRSVTALLVEGPAPSAEFRCAALLDECGNGAETGELHGHNSDAFWSFVGDVKPFVKEQSRSVWRVSLPPASAPLFVQHLSEFLPEAQYYLDWAGGLVWVSVPADIDRAGVDIIRSSLLDGGHATLVRADMALRQDVSPFHPQNKVLAQMSERVRQGFDPKGIFNPGRMYPIGDVT
ncbi:FAD-binding protein [Sneathiella aquimaris]|uniref:FAD-binding protein n=1 Tax=Sneathiella aquimaris TaxID=2599305 RepID=UPI00146E7D27|nr:FAD-binding protein [Sneathiella aquimaris]